MCGRFTIMTDLELLMDRFNAYTAVDDFQPRYNVAPSQNVLAVINDGTRNKIGHLRWGLIPSWAKDMSVGNKLINARAETLTEKPSFKEAFKRRRCMVVADSFYEWRLENGKKTPVRIMLKNEEPFAFAALWDRWKSPQGAITYSCTIITTAPNELVSPIHNRMPAILKKENEHIWLNPAEQNEEELSKLLESYSAEEMKTYDVSSLVNSPFHDDPRCVEAITLG